MMMVVSKNNVSSWIRCVLRFSIQEEETTYQAGYDVYWGSLYRRRKQRIKLDTMCTEVLYTGGGNDVSSWIWCVLRFSIREEETTYQAGSVLRFSIREEETTYQAGYDVYWGSLYRRRKQRIKLDLYWGSLYRRRKQRIKLDTMCTEVLYTGGGNNVSSWIRCVLRFSIQEEETTYQAGYDVYWGSLYGRRKQRIKLDTMCTEVLYTGGGNNVSSWIRCVLRFSIQEEETTYQAGYDVYWGSLYGRRKQRIKLDTMCTEVLYTGGGNNVSSWMCTEVLYTGGGNDVSSWIRCVLRFSIQEEETTYQAGYDVYWGSLYGRRKQRIKLDTMCTEVLYTGGGNDVSSWIRCVLRFSIQEEETTYQAGCVLRFSIREEETTYQAGCVLRFSIQEEETTYQAGYDVYWGSLYRRRKQRIKLDTMCTEVLYTGGGNDVSSWMCTEVLYTGGGNNVSSWIRCVLRFSIREEETTYQAGYDVYWGSLYRRRKQRIKLDTMCTEVLYTGGGNNVSSWIRCVLRFSIQEEETTYQAGYDVYWGSLYRRRKQRIKLDTMCTEVLYTGGGNNVSSWIRCVLRFSIQEEETTYQAGCVLRFSIREEETTYQAGYDVYWGSLYRRRKQRIKLDMMCTEVLYTGGGNNVSSWIRCVLRFSIQEEETTYQAGYDVYWGSLYRRRKQRIKLDTMCTEVLYTGGGNNVSSWIRCVLRFSIQEEETTYQAGYDVYWGSLYRRRKQRIKLDTMCTEVLYTGGGNNVSSWIRCVLRFSIQEEETTYQAGYVLRFSIQEEETTYQAGYDVYWGSLYGRRKQRIKLDTMCTEVLYTGGGNNVSSWIRCVLRFSIQEEETTYQAGCVLRFSIQEEETTYQAGYDVYWGSLYGRRKQRIKLDVYWGSLYRRRKRRIKLDTMCTEVLYTGGGNNVSSWIRCVLRFSIQEEETTYQAGCVLRFSIQEEETTYQAGYDVYWGSLYRRRKRRIKLDTMCTEVLYTGGGNNVSSWIRCVLRFSIQEEETTYQAGYDVYWGSLYRRRKRRIKLDTMCTEVLYTGGGNDVSSWIRCVLRFSIQEEETTYQAGYDVYWGSLYRRRKQRIKLDTMCTEVLYTGGGNDLSSWIRCVLRFSIQEEETTYQAGYDVYWGSLYGRRKRCIKLDTMCTEVLYTGGGNDVSSWMCTEVLYTGGGNNVSSWIRCVLRFSIREEETTYQAGYDVYWGSLYGRRKQRIKLDTMCTEVLYTGGGNNVSSWIRCVLRFSIREEETTYQAGYDVYWGSLYRRRKQHIKVDTMCTEVLYTGGGNDVSSWIRCVLRFSIREEETTYQAGYDVYWGSLYRRRKQRLKHVLFKCETQWLKCLKSVKRNY